MSEMTLKQLDSTSSFGIPRQYTASLATRNNEGQFSLYIPPGHGKPGYVPENISFKCGLAIILLGILAYALVPLRLYTRACITKTFGVDDWLIAGAAFVLLGVETCHFLLLFKWEIGLHAVDYIEKHSFTGLSETFKLVYITSIFYSCGMCLLKASVLWFFRRIITLGKTRHVLNFMTVIILIFSIVWIAMVTFICIPPHLYWSSIGVENKGKCIPVQLLSHITGIGHAITDVIVWTLPIPSILKLQLSWKDKISTCLLFVVGGGAVAASIVRAAYYSDKLFATDGTYATAKLILYCNIELSLGLICASLFTVKVLITRHCPRSTHTHTILSDDPSDVFKLERMPSSRTNREHFETELP